MTLGITQHAKEHCEVATDHQTNPFTTTSKYMLLCSKILSTNYAPIRLSKQADTPQHIKISNTCRLPKLSMSPLDSII